MQKKQRRKTVINAKNEQRLIKQRKEEQRERKKQPQTDWGQITLFNFSDKES